MDRMILLYFSFICTVGLACCTRTPDEKLFVVEKGGLFYPFAFPFKDGKAKVTYEGQAVVNGEYTVWESSSWIFIDNPLRK